jgi:ATP-binding cassette subfamily C protein/ATP-binding cassette subfamily C protein EexD
VALVGAFLLFGLAVVTEFYTRAGVNEAGRLANEANRFAAAALRNGEVVRGLGMGDVVLDRWSGAQYAHVAVHSAATERGAALHALVKFVRLSVQITLLCAGAWLAIDRQISPGAMMAASIIMGRALAPIEQIVGQWKRIVAFRTSFNRLENMFQALPLGEAPTALPKPVGDLEVTNAVIWPPNASRPAVKGVSLSLKAGESIAIVGASASGKSTLARALAGVWPLREGSVRIDGAEYGQWDQNQLGKHIGYLPQDIELFSGTVGANINRFETDNDGATLRAAQRARVHDLVLRLRDGYETPVGEGGIALSGGTRQRIGLARAVYGAPSLVVLDEPSSNLDASGDSALADCVHDLKKDGTTTVVISHRLSTLGVVDKLLLLRDGQALMFGPRAEVLAKLSQQQAAEGGPGVQPVRRIRSGG